MTLATFGSIEHGAGQSGAEACRLRECKPVHTERSQGPNVIFQGANIHIVSGSGATVDSTGLGNLVIGYNKDTLDPQGIDAARYGSHNLIVGPQHEYIASGGIVGGYGNSIGDDYSSVTAGACNIAGPATPIAGSQQACVNSIPNISNGFASSVSRGIANTAIGVFTSVSGGTLNVAGYPYSSVSGGSWNQTGGPYPSISGGFENLTAGSYDSIGGGNGQTAFGPYQNIN
jgi:hypothetical protein